MSNTNHDFLVKNGLVVGQAITSTGTLTQAGQTFPASDGSAGQYLKTNGSGALSWGTVNTSFNITDGTTTDTVGSTETVTFTGGTNISLAVTDNTVTITNDVVDSDDITEGSSNLFYTDARAIAAIQGASNLTIDGGTLYVDTAADRVGISDTSPQQKLDVAGNIGVNGSEVIDASGNIVGSVADSAMTVGGSLAGVLSNLKVQYGTAYSGTPIQGSFFFDSLNQKLKVYTGSAFIDAVPAGSGGGGGGGATDANTTFRNYSYTLTGTTSAVSGVDDNELTAGAFIIGHKYTITSVGNTDFTAIGASGNTVGVVFTATGVGSGTGQAKQTLFYDTTSSTTRVVAYVNGIKQVYGSGRDFVATTGTSVAFTYNLGSGDTVDIQVYELLTNAAYYLKSEVYTQTQVNSQISTGVSAYLPLAGGTMTGTLNVTQASTADTIKLTRGTTAHNNMIKFVTGSTDKWIVGQRNDSTDHFRFYSYGTSSDVLSIQTDGNIGIGTTSPLNKLVVAEGTGQHGVEIAPGTLSYIQAYDRATSDYGDLSIDAQTIRFATDNGTERMRIDSSGNVGIGGTPTSGGNGARWLTLDTPSTNTYSGGILYKINGTTKAYHYVENDHIMHQTTSGVGQKFYAGTSVAMTLNSSGNLIQGNNGTHSWTAINNTLFAAGGIGVTSNSDWGLQMAGSTTERIRFFTSSGGTGTVGNISVSTAGTTYSTTSDRRLKNNIEPIVDATDKLMDMKPVTHTWIDNPEAPQVHGFIAQEMQEVVPEAVSGDAESDEMMSMDYGRITPVIVAALQDALNEIKELKTRIDELENN